MPDVINVNHLDQLKQFLNNKNVIEIVERQTDQKIKTFQKVALINLADESLKQDSYQFISSLGFKNASLSVIRHVSSLEGLGLVLNGLNLGVTIAGFAIMANKLSELERSIKELEHSMQQGFLQEALYKYRNVLRKYESMLDSRKREKAFDEHDLQDLVNDLDNVLRHFLDFLKQYSQDANKQIIELIFSLLSMLTISLRYFDELYYSNHRHKAYDGDYWHLSHDSWMETYEMMTSSWFVEKLQDYCLIDNPNNWLPYGMDIYVVSLLDQVETWRHEVLDNQSLIVELDNMEDVSDIEVLNLVREEVSERVKKRIIEKLNEASLSDELHEKVLETLQWI